MLSEYEKKMVTERILEEVGGRMMGDIVLLETMKADGRSCRVFKLKFAVGEFDMVEYDTEKIWGNPSTLCIIPWRGYGDRGGRDLSKCRELFKNAF